MPGEAITIGPFVGGLNNISQAGASDDKELTELVNFEVSRDTSLTSRPPMTVVPNSVITSTEQYEILGIFRETDVSWFLLIQVREAARTVIYSCPKGDLSAKIQVQAVTDHKNRTGAFCQVAEWGYFCPVPGANRTTEAGFKWKPGATSLVAIVQMPSGTVMVSHKGRLWIAGATGAVDNSKLSFSAIGTAGPTLEIWNATDFINVAPGEGGFITSILALNSSILIFKDDGTWRFSFPSSPTKGQVDKISGYIGATGRKAVAEFENLVYVYDKGKIYELINNVYTEVNTNVQFTNDSDSPDLDVSTIELSIAARRLFVHYRNAVYVYNLNTRTWSQWRSNAGIPGPFIELPQDLSSINPSMFFAPSKGKEQNPALTYYNQIALRDSLVYVNTLLPANTTVTQVGTKASLQSTQGVAIPRTEVYFNVENGEKGFNLNTSVGRRLRISGAIENLPGNSRIIVTYQKYDGSLEFRFQNLAVGTNAFDLIFTTPADCIAAFAKLEILNWLPSVPVIISDLRFSSAEGPAPISLLSFSDYYPDGLNVVERIECILKTKAYDYKAASVYKRLFWWGIDHKSDMRFYVRAVPVVSLRPVTWGRLKAYTWQQLMAGTWGNPLTFLGIDTAVSDSSDVSNVVTSNGRIFTKMRKSLRFRQISYEVRMFTLGNKGTGPAKVFSFVTYVKPKEKVVDTNS